MRTVLAHVVHGCHGLCSCHVLVTPTPREPRGTSTCLSTMPFRHAFGTVVNHLLVPEPCTSPSWRRFDGNASIRGHSTMATRHVATTIGCEYILSGEGRRVSTQSAFERQREKTLEASSRRRGTMFLGSIHEPSSVATVRERRTRRIAERKKQHAHVVDSRSMRGDDGHGQGRV